MTKILLASASAARISVLENAGVSFAARPANIDERAVEAPLAEAGASPADIAAALAEKKALAVAGLEPDACVIGADQVLSADDRRWNKPGDLGEARVQLKTLSGRVHELHTAVAVVHRNAIAWRHSETAKMTIRHLSGEEIDRYLDAVGDKALSSVGAYQIEGPGIRLFDRIEGDYFAILGLPMLPLLSYLRQAGLLDAKTGEEAPVTGRQT